MYCSRILLANCSKSRKSCCLIWLTFVPGVRIVLSPLANKFIWLYVNCLFERFLICFLSASNCALVLLVRLFLRLCLHILLDILFPFSLGLRLRDSGNKPVYFSICLFVISCNFANISLHWLSFSIKLLAIQFTFVVSALWLDFKCSTLLFLAVSFLNYGLLPRCFSLLRLIICLWWKRERALM